MIKTSCHLLLHHVTLELHSKVICHMVPTNVSVCNYCCFGSMHSMLDFPQFPLKTFREKTGGTVLSPGFFAPEHPAKQVVRRCKAISERATRAALSAKRSS